MTVRELDRQGACSAVARWTQLDSNFGCVERVVLKAKRGLDRLVRRIKHCANRYGVSLTAAARQCAEVCDQRVVVAVACDGALVKAWASTSAFKSGAYQRAISAEWAAFGLDWSL